MIPIRIDPTVPPSVLSIISVISGKPITKMYWVSSYTKLRRKAKKVVKSILFLFLNKYINIPRGMKNAIFNRTSM